MGKGKKARKQDDDWENDFEELAKESGITLGGDITEDFEMPVTKKKEKKGKKKKAAVEDEDEDSDQEAENISRSAQISTNKASFNALLIAEDDSGEEQGSDNSDEEIKKPTPKQKALKDKHQKEKEEEETEAIKHDIPEKKKTKGKKKEKPKKKEEEDIDALLADLELSEKKEPENKKGKKKGKKKDSALETSNDTESQQVEESMNGVEDDTNVELEKATVEAAVKVDAVKLDDEDSDEGPKLKTAAQKKAEKKEREKQKKEAQKAAAKKAKGKEEKGKDDSVEQPQTTSTKSDEISLVPSESDKPTESSAQTVEQEAPAAKEGDGNEAAEGEKPAKEDSGESEGEGESKDKKKKKKKKKKAAAGEEEKPKSKKIGKLAVKKMQELLEKKKEEEERIRQEEEAKIKAFEEAENRRLEKLRLEQERRDKKKQKEKERKERLKKEGKLLTPQQREAKRRAELMLSAMKEQGIEVPSKETVAEKKKVQYVAKRQKSKQAQSQAPDKIESKEEPTSEVPKEDASDVNTGQETEKKEEPKDAKEEEAPDSWDQLGDEDDVKDSWDAESDKETGGPKTDEQQNKATPEVPAEPNKDTTEESKESSEETEESEESSSDEEEESSEEESESEDEKLTADKIKERARDRIRKRRVQAEANRSTEKLRCPVICVLGHVDTGKTKILDKIRHTHVQDGEAGGITQQIGATLVPVDAIKEQTKMVKEFLKFDLRLPGLLIIDTPGHESFSNLRSRGSSLCDMAILVVDIMHGLEPQTIESINLLRKKQTPFVVALNKIDRLFEWKRGPASQVEDTIKKQKKNTKLEYEERLQQIIGEFAEQGLNAAPFYKNLDEKVYISLVPTSAHSGDGMGDLMSLICRLTQDRLAKKLAFSEEIQCTVMEVKALPGLGTTLDVILVNGRLREGDTIVTGGLEGPIVTQVRAVLTPQPMRELRVKSQYIQHKQIEAAQGLKISGKDLEKVMAGAPLFVAEKDDEIDVYKDEVNEIVADTLQAIKVSDRGVYVQASTLGSLEALLEFLKTSKISYSGVNIGPVHKKDVMRASVMLEHEKMFAVILAFDVKVEREAQDFADKEGVKIFTADIIYHLFDKFTAYTEEYKQKKREEFKNIAIFPAKLRVMPQHIFNTRDPIVIGVHIEGGSIRLGTPLAVPSKEFVEIGFVTGIEANHKQMEKAVAGQEVCIKIEPISGDAPKMYGRHFTHEDVIMSKINRESIDALKNYFREEMQKSDWQLIIEMKKIFGII